MKHLRQVADYLIAFLVVHFPPLAPLPVVSLSPFLLASFLILVVFLYLCLFYVLS